METKIAIYSRKSKFTGKGESIENQIEMCRQYVTMHYGETEAGSARVYEDEGFSGGTLDRPQFKVMMADAKKGLFNVIVVYRLDRISRNIGDFAKLIEELNDLGIGFVSIKEQFDTSTPVGRAMMYISSVFSQLERETIAERIRDNMHELSKTGRWLGGITPTGYGSESVSKVNVDGRVKKAYKLCVIPEEMEVVKQIFKTFLKTNSLTKTDTYLLNNGYHTKNNKRYTRFAIRAILTNPVYMIADADAYAYFQDNGANVFAEAEEFDGTHGIMAYNRTDQKKGRTTAVRPINEWIVAIGGHEGVIDGKTWVKVQAMLDVNKSKAYRKPRSSVALLSGLLVCGNCGEFMRPKMTNRVNSKGEFVYTYKCNMKERSHGHQCNIRDCNGNVLDAAIIDQIKALSEDGSGFLKNLDNVKRSFVGNKQEYEQEISTLQKNLDENEAQIKRVVATISMTDDPTVSKYLVKQIEELHGKNVKLQDRITYLKGVIATSAVSGKEFDLLAQMMSSFKDMVDDMTVEQKRAAIRTFVKQIIWDGNDVHVILFGSDYNFEFPKEPVRIENITNNEGKVNFKLAAERSDESPLSEDSKRDPDVFQKPAQERGGSVFVRLHRRGRGREQSLPDGRDLRRGRRIRASQLPGGLRAAPVFCGERPGAQGTAGGHPALRPSGRAAPDPEADGGEAGHLPLLYLPYREEGAG